MSMRYLFAFGFALGSLVFIWNHPPLLRAVSAFGSNARVKGEKGVQRLTFGTSATTSTETATPIATLLPGPIVTPSPLPPSPTTVKATATATATATVIPATPTIPVIPTVLPVSRRYIPVVMGGTTTLVRCRLDGEQIHLGEETILYLEVLDVANLYGYQLNLYFDNDVVQLNGVLQDGIEGMVLGNFLSPDFVFSNEIDNVSGVVFLALTQVNPNPPRSGSGELARAIVRGVHSDVVEFSFESVNLEDPEENEIESSHRNCVLTVLE